jgi:RNA polymerase sigma factor for flagellar operon FliA
LHLRPSPASEIIPDRQRAPVSHEHLFIENLKLIDAVVGAICDHNHLSGASADDFRSQAYIKLIDNDYQVLRQFEGRSSLKTFLTTVLKRELLDCRVREWGKFRPSREANRLGSEARLLELYMVRDGLTFDEAVEVLRTSHGVTTSRDALYSIAERLPVRVSRRPQGEEAMAHLPDPAPLPDGSASRAELRARAARAHDALDRALDALDPDDRLIVKLHFYDGLGLGVAVIARQLRLEQKPLYRRLGNIVAGLKERLVDEGLAADVVAELLDESWSDLLEPALVKPGAEQ